MALSSPSLAPRILSTLRLVAAYLSSGILEIVGGLVLPIGFLGAGSLSVDAPRRRR